MTIRNRTPHAVPHWISIADVARELGVSRWTAQRRVRAGSIPGGERMYAHDRGERWHVDRAIFSQWLHQMHQTGS
jgi:hypothetical protein